MRTKQEIIQLLNLLEIKTADDLEAQDLDFKQWNGRNYEDNFKTMIDMAVCMANGGGGHTLFGVADRKIGRKKAILGVPLNLDPKVVIHRVYQETNPHLQVEAEFIDVSEGTGKLLLVSSYGERRPYHLIYGKARIRKGKSCYPLRNQ